MFALIVSTMLVTVTSYRSVPEQTDSSPFITSIGHRVSEQGIAVSQDLIRTKQACYGDVVYVPGFGIRVVNDTMNRRHRNWVDLWVNTRVEEATVGVRKSVHVMVIKSPERCCGKPCQMNVPIYSESTMDKLVTRLFGGAINVAMYYKSLWSVTAARHEVVTKL